MLFAFVIGLLISNFVIVLLSSVGFVSSQARERLYVAVGAVAGLFSLFVGTIFLFGLEGAPAGPRSDLPVLRRAGQRPSADRAQLAVTVSVPFIPRASCDGELADVACTRPASSVTVSSRVSPGTSPSTLVDDGLALEDLELVLGLAGVGDVERHRPGLGAIVDGVNL